MGKENRSRFLLPNELLKYDTKSPEKAASNESSVAPSPVVGVDTEDAALSELKTAGSDILKLRYDEVESLPGISTTVRETVAEPSTPHYEPRTPQVADARNVHYEPTTPHDEPSTPPYESTPPVISNKRRRYLCRAPKPKHVWKPSESRITFAEAEALRPPIMSRSKLKRRHLSSDPRKQQQYNSNIENEQVKFTDSSSSRPDSISPSPSKKRRSDIDNQAQE